MDYQTETVAEYEKVSFWESLDLVEMAHDAEDAAKIVIPVALAVGTGGVAAGAIIAGGATGGLSEAIAGIAAWVGVNYAR